MRHLPTTKFKQLLIIQKSVRPSKENKDVDGSKILAQSSTVVTFLFFWYNNVKSKSLIHSTIFTLDRYVALHSHRLHVTCITEEHHFDVTRPLHHYRVFKMKIMINYWNMTAYDFLIFKLYRSDIIIQFPSIIFLRQCF